MAKADKKITVLCFLSFFLSFISASFAADFHSPRTAGLGGAGHAGPILNDAIYLNPSYTSFLPTYSVSYSFLKFSSSDESFLTNPFPNGRYYNVSLLDGRSQLFQAGVGYTVREDGSFIHFGASKSVVKRFGFGFGGKMFFNGSESTDSLRELTFSSTGIVSDAVQIALIVDNLLQSESSIEANLYRQIIFGSKINIMDIVIAYIDPHYTPDLPDESTWGYEVGLEFTMLKDIFFRLGYFKNSVVPFISERGRGVSTGIGWFGPKLSLDYAFTRVLERSSGLPNASSHTLGFTLYF